MGLSPFLAMSMYWQVIVWACLNPFPAQKPLPENKE
jgi:hypothetical protein